MTDWISGLLAKHDAVLTGKHFVYTMGQHGPDYVNLRVLAPFAAVLYEIASEMVHSLPPDLDAIVGPETLGRSLTEHAGSILEIPSLWCDYLGEGPAREAVWPPKLGFKDILEPGMRVAMFDDLLNGGSSLKLLAGLIRESGAEVVSANVVVNRSPEVTAESLGVTTLNSLLEIGGFVKYHAIQCKLCAQRVPMVLRPGHGHEWIKSHPDYPVAT
jgi:orotate phosphoribosyltransferase